MFFLYSFVTTKPCLFRSTYLHFIISSFLGFQGAHKSCSILFKIIHVKGKSLFFTLFNAHILCCSMVLYNYLNIFIDFLIHIQPTHLRFLPGWPAIFICVICQHFLVLVGSSVIIIMLVVHLPLCNFLVIPYYHIQAACNIHQLKSLSIVHMCFRIFWDLHLVVFAPLFILRLPPPTSAFQQLRHILPCFIPYFRMAY